MKIRMLRPVRVRDREGKVLKEYLPGEILEATMDCGHYWMAGPGIFKDEAELLPETPETLVERFFQLSNN